MVPVVGRSPSPLVAIDCACSVAINAITTMIIMKISRNESFNQKERHATTRKGQARTAVVLRHG